jgi:hypothetical protein
MRGNSREQTTAFSERPVHTARKSDTNDRLAFISHVTDRDQMIISLPPEDAHIRFFTKQGNTPVRTTRFRGTRGTFRRLVI